MLKDTYWLFTSLLSMIIIIMTINDVKAQVTGNEQIYENPDLGIRFTYPGTWELSTNTERIDPGVLVDINEPNSIGPPFPYSLAVYIAQSKDWPVLLGREDLNPPDTLDNLIETYTGALKNSDPTISIEELSTTTLASNPAKKMIHTYTDYSGPNRETTIIAMKGDNIYSARYFGPDDRYYSELWPVVENVIRSIEITNPPNYALGIQ